MCPLPVQSSHTPKSPRPVLENIFAFAPNRDTLGGTSYFIVGNQGNILIDCPNWDATNQDFIHSHGGVRWLFITHRGAIAKHTTAITESTNCEILIQEQEAYLLPGMSVTSFEQECKINQELQLIWTPGHSPGSACLYYSAQGGVLFTGRHLLPNQQGEPVPLRSAKTFHWFRQLHSIQVLQARFTPSTLQYLCPGANLGFLRGKRFVDNAYEKLSQLDLPALRAIKPIL